MAGRPSRRPGRRASHDVTFPVAIAIGVAQALALVPGISRSGISISAARFAGLDREAAARFSFLMATPVTAGAALFEVRKLVAGEAGVDVSVGAPRRRAWSRRFVSGMLAIGVLLRYLRTRSLERLRLVSARAGRRSSSSSGWHASRGPVRWRS